MVRSWFLLLCLLLSSLTTATAIHARELAGAIDIECSGYVHGPGDGDRTSGDPDDAIPHHHGKCHGTAACLPTREAGSEATAAIAIAMPYPEVRVLSRWISGPDLRPPIAA